MQGPLIHIGYPKAASTWLQQVIFTNEQLGYLGLRTREDRTRLLQEIVAQHPLSYDPGPLAAYYANRLQSADQPDLLPVLSAERFCGNIHSGGYDVRQTAERLRQLFPDARILIIIREQKGIIHSSYQQYIREGGPYTLKRYLRPPERGRTRVPMFAFEYFAYDLITRLYVELFGMDRVKVLPMEMLRSEPQEFVTQIQQFCGRTVQPDLLEQLPFTSKVNKGMGPYTIALKRHFNRFFVDDRLNPGVLFPRLGKAGGRFISFMGRLENALPKGMVTRKKNRLRKKVNAEVGSYYQESNQRLQEATGLDLGRFGYDV
jgi:hypothetical protein